MDKAEIRVAVGVIENTCGEVLIALRPPGVHQEGLWEFPGGKVEPGETVREALCRELFEELGIAVELAAPLLVVRHDYPNLCVVLDTWRVHRFGGIPRGCLGQKICWVQPGDLPAFEFPEANRPIVAAVRLPRYYPILDDATGNHNAMWRNLMRLVDGGHELIQLRAKKLDARSYRCFASECVDYCKGRGVGLILNAEPALVVELGAAGVHLTSRRLKETRTRPLGWNFWVSASCHDRVELRQAESVGVDFAVLGPVRPTASHPGVEPLGWERFAACMEASNLPVFALGGLQKRDLARAQSLGGWGIAGIRGFLGAD
ncbi:MAG TPA: Nudix family hydrolase [Methylococcus sp.]|nr:Nudix family hydrolase [Methylococcus sp.]